MQNRSEDERNTEQPHEANATDAGTGQGTVSDTQLDEDGTGTLDRPVLDGATESDAAEAATDDPFRGVEDPALLHPPHLSRGEGQDENDDEAADEELTIRPDLNTP